MDIDALAKEAVTKGSMQKASELAFLLEKAQGAKVVVEIGCATGGTLWAMAQVADDNATIIGLGLPGKVFSVPGYDETRVEDVSKLGKPTQKLYFIEKNSHTKEALNELKTVLGGKEIDVLFIDADHTWLGCKTDWLTYSPLVKDGGIIGFHDIGDYPFHADNFAEVNRVWAELKTKFKYDEFIDPSGGNWGGIGILYHDTKVKFKDTQADKLTSIIIPVRYRPDLTRVCLDSIVAYTKSHYELILVQEGEDEDLTTLLKGYKAKFIQNKQPKGFAGAMNTGLELATGDYYCFFNNDTVATPGWLEEMLKVFEDERVGLVAPTFTESQTNQSVDGNRGQMIEPIDDPIQLKGVCFLVSRKVMDKVGKWDESFGMGGGEDSDLCLRIKKAGYQLIIARQSYIYHYGSASFRELFNNDADYSKKFSVNQFNKVKKKHQITGKPSVFISIPCFSGNINHELALRLIQWSHDPEIIVKIKFYTNLAPLDHARNTAVKEFLEDYNDYFFHIDDTIVPPADALRDLLSANKEIIAPVCFSYRQGDGGIYAPMPVALRYDLNKQYRPFVGKGIEETDVVTGGCHLVKREVFEKLERPYYFTYHKNGTVIYSEDFVFSQQCQALGYKLYTHFDVICKHYKNIDIKTINDLMANYGR